MMFRKKLILVAFIALIFFGFAGVELSANFIPELTININPGDLDDDIAFENIGATISLQILFLTVLIALLPSILVVMTTFTRIIIVLSFTRSALGTQQMPPNTVLLGLALFLTIFIMNPVIQEINAQAFQPFTAGEIGQGEAIDLAMEPMREFMFQHASTDNLEFFAAIAGLAPGDVQIIDDIPNHVLIPAFILNEITTGFAIGVFIYIPFIVIDMVVASVLMAMGMMMLPPAMISLPFKVLLFVLIDGWAILMEVLFATFVS